MSAHNDPAPPRKDSVLIYVVDDDSAVRPLVVASLKRAGFDVWGFPSAEAALEVLRSSQRRPRLLVTDYQMPGMNGLELIAECRKLAPEVKSLSISGTPGLVTTQIPGGKPDAFMPKPFAPSELIAIVQELMRNA